MALREGNFKSSINLNKLSGELKIHYSTLYSAYRRSNSEEEFLNKIEKYRKANGNIINYTPYRVCEFSILIKEFPDVPFPTIGKIFRRANKSIDTAREMLKNYRENKETADKIKCIEKKYSVSYRSIIAYINKNLKKKTNELTEEDFEKIEQHYIKQKIHSVLNKELKIICEERGLDIRKAKISFRNFNKNKKIEDLTDKEIKAGLKYIRERYLNQKGKCNFRFKAPLKFDLTPYDCITHFWEAEYKPYGIALATVRQYQKVSNTKEEFINKLNTLAKKHTKYPKEKRQELDNQLEKLAGQLNMELNYMKSLFCRHLGIKVLDIIEDPSLMDAVKEYLFNIYYKKEDKHAAGNFKLDMPLPQLSKKLNIKYGTLYKAYIRSNTKEEFLNNIEKIKEYYKDTYQYTEIK